MKQALIGIIMGSDSDWTVMKGAADALGELLIPYETSIVSAHRSPQRLYGYAQSAQSRGLQAVIAGAGGAAHLPGMVASLTALPVIGVPIMGAKLQGLDSLLSIAQMPSGVPVATMAIDGSRNAGLFAARLLALGDRPLARRLAALTKAQARGVRSKNHAWDAAGPEGWRPAEGQAEPTPRKGRKG